MYKRQNAEYFVAMNQWQIALWHYSNHHEIMKWENMYSNL
jgi:hypothetical protein